MQSVRSLAFLLMLPAAGLAQGKSDVPQSWQDFVAKNGNWTAEWNAATGTPEAIYGQGLKVADELTTLAQARARSVALLEKHADLLGRGDSQFIERDSAQVRHLYYFIYKQQYKGLDVISARADVRINNSGVVAMFGSKAVPMPKGFVTAPAIGTAAARKTAELEILGREIVARDVAAPRLVIWADTNAKKATTPRLAWEVQVGDPQTGKFGKAYIDAATGVYFDYDNQVFYCATCKKPHVRGAHNNPRLARGMAKIATLKPTNAAGQMALTGKVMGWCNTTTSGAGTLSNVPLRNLLVTSSAGNAYTDSSGNFSIAYSGTSAVTVSATLTGRHLKRVRVSQGTQMSASASVTPGTAGTIQFGASNSAEFDRAQTTMYYWANDINVWVRGVISGQSTAMNRMSTINPRVNIASSCNAYYTGLTINHYASSSSCNNTSFSSVIIHEWGHGLDDVFGGVARTDGLSEGWADVLSIARLMDPVVGRYFRKNGGIVRTATNTLKYPTGSSSVHTQGQVWMGWFWDLRNNLVASKGTAAGQALAIKIVVPSIVADATSMSAQIREVFLLDDNDGNLNNGTPNYNDLEKASLKRTVPYPKRVNPNAGSYSLYGKGCAGSGKLPGGTCLSDNTTRTSRSSTGYAGVIYLLEVNATQTVDVAGYELLTRSRRTGNVTVTTHLYSADSNGRPSTRLAGGTMTIGSSAGFYKTAFNKSVQFTKGSKFFIGFTNSNPTFNLGTVTTGNVTPYWRNNGTGGSWIRFTTRAWGWKVTCKGTQGGAVPALSNSGVPELNKKFSLNLSNANPNSAAFLLLGFSDKTWLGASLPLSLKNFGADGCFVYASGDILIPMKTDTSGNYTGEFTVANNASYFGITFYNQFAIADTANNFGIVMSNAGRGKIGKQ